MGKRRILKGVIMSLVIAATINTTVFAKMPSGTAVIGKKAYDLNYLMNASEEDKEQIRLEIIKGTEIYVKDFAGNWVFNSTNDTVEKPSETIPAVIYKNASGDIIEYEAGDGNEAATQEDLLILDIS